MCCTFRLGDSRLWDCRLTYFRAENTCQIHAIALGESRQCRVSKELQGLLRSALGRQTLLHGTEWQASRVGEIILLDP